MKFRMLANMFKLYIMALPKFLSACALSADWLIKILYFLIICRKYI